jgi:hypothetical protein
MFEKCKKFENHHRFLIAYISGVSRPILILVVLNKTSLTGLEVCMVVQGRNPRTTISLLSTLLWTVIPGHRVSNIWLPDTNVQGKTYFSLESTIGP